MKLPVNIKTDFKMLFIYIVKLFPVYKIQLILFNLVSIIT